MKPNSKTQDDRNLDFDGMAGNGVNRGANKYAGNQWGGQQNPNKTFNEGVGPRMGNQDYRGVNGPSATKDAFRPTPNTKSVPGTKIGNVDSINFGKQERNPGGTRAWDPKSGQNYNGNPDRINVSGYSMGDGKMSKGKNPVGRELGMNEDGLNFGPKSQYPGAK
jgi:hypothetical protein